MIYVVITDLQNSKWDCRIARQPHYILTDQIREYIEKTRNENKITERTLAYTTLLCSLDRFFSVKEPVIDRNHNGKPALLNCDIHISISHCDGVAVTALTDDGEIGVDIQSVIDEDKAKRLEERFLSGISVKQNEVNIKYFSVAFTDKGACFNEILTENDETIDFLSKWVYTESVIKAFGLSFSDISKINDLSSSTETKTVKYKNFKIATTIAK